MRFGLPKRRAIGRGAEIFRDGFAQRARADAVHDSHFGAIGEKRLVEEILELAKRVGGAHPDQIQFAAHTRFAAEADSRRTFAWRSLFDRYHRGATQALR